MVICHAFSRAGLCGALVLGAISASLGQGPYQSPVSDEIFYHIMPIAWRDSNNDAQRFGDLGGMSASLNYLQALGVTSVWMNPIFPSPAYHGYQHGPADQIDPDLGTEAKFMNFLADARARGIKVYLDFVAYGISHDSTWFQSAFMNPASQYDSWLAFTNGGNTEYLGSVYNSWNGASVGFIHWDLRTPETRALVTSWARKWLDPDNNPMTDDGVAGYRFDHCWVNYPSGPSGWGYNLDSFWRPFFADLRATKPDVFNFGEQANWGSFGGEFLSEFDAMFTKPFEFAARDALANEIAQPLYDRMATTVSSAIAAQRGTFLGIIGDHDVDRLASAIGGGSPLAPSKMHAAAAVLMLQPFAPVIYFGDEIGMRGTKQNYGSDANDIPMREPFKWNAVAGPPMSNYYVLNSRAFADRFSRDNDQRSVQEQNGVSGSLLERYRALIALRRQEAALRRGDYRPVQTNQTAVWSFVRRYEPQGAPAENLLVAINLRSVTLNTTCNLSGFNIDAGTATVTDVLGGPALPNLTAGNRAAYPVQIQPYSFRVLRIPGISPIPTPPPRVTGADIPARFGPQNLLATQDTPTTFGNNANELNQLFAVREPGGLRIGLTGNLNTDGTGLVVLVDAQASGQNILWLYDQFPPPSGLAELSDTRFDDGFVPETMLFINAFGSSIYVDQLALQNMASVKTYRGRGTVNIGNGFLVEGSNNGGLEVALNNSNQAGVTDTSATNAATAISGADIFISNEYLGLMTPACGQFKVAAFISGFNGTISSQWLPGRGGVAANLGIAPDMRTIPGLQYANVSTPPPGCPMICLGDANGDNLVSFPDITDVLRLFGVSYPPGTVPTPGDANGDNLVSFPDITSVLGNWAVVCN